LIYDITDDRVRGKVADFCLDYGLDRIQYSAFVGQISRNHTRELMRKIQARIGRSTAKVMLLTIPADAWEERIVYEQEGRDD
jgi:CRISPR-associated protein Cas2